jgi:hypothetical protein
MIYPLTGKYAIQNFLKIFEACISDFRHQKFREWRLVQRCQGNNRAAEDNNKDGLSEPSSTLNSSGPGSNHAKRKFSYVKFAENEGRMFSALKYRELWIESFFIQSLVWAFATLFKEEQRNNFLDHIKSKIFSNQPPAVGNSLRIDQRSRQTGQSASASTPHINIPPKSSMIHIEENPGDKSAGLRPDLS